MALPGRRLARLREIGEEAVRRLHEVRDAAAAALGQRLHLDENGRCDSWRQCLALAVNARDFSRSLRSTLAALVNRVRIGAGNVPLVEHEGDCAAAGIASSAIRVLRRDTV